MTKSKNKSSKAEKHYPLFDYIKKADRLIRQSDDTPPGSLDIDTELKAAISQDIKHATDSTGMELSRAQIAARMTDLTGTEISLSMLNNWTARSHDHRFPCQFLPAFVIATGGRRAFGVLSRTSGLFALPGLEVIRAEIQKLTETQKKVKEEKQEWTVLLKKIEEEEVRDGE